MTGMSGRISRQLGQSLQLVDGRGERICGAKHHPVVLVDRLSLQQNLPGTSKGSAIDRVPTCRSSNMHCALSSVTRRSSNLSLPASNSSCWCAAATCPCRAVAVWSSPTSA